MTSMGVMLAGRGFVIDADVAKRFLKTRAPDVVERVRPLRNGRDLLDECRNAWVIDFTGLTADQARERHPVVYDHLLAHAKPERDANRDAQFRGKWWLFGRSRPDLRAMTHGLSRYIATVETAKHRLFMFMDAAVLPEHRLIAIGSADAFHLGVLSSRIHIVYALAAGGTLEDRPVYNKTRCFDPFPFPAADAAAKERVRGLAEALDAHRKRAQEAHGIGLTAMYNVLEKLRAASRSDGGPRSVAAEVLTPAERELHDRALVSTLRQLHDDLDAAVAAAYGWPWPMADAEILERVVALNVERVAEETRGVIRWLRPDYQNPPAGKSTQTDLGLAASTARPRPSAVGVRKPPRKAAKEPWPKSLPEQVRAVEAALAAGGPRDAKAMAALFLRARADTVREILDTLATLGRM
jgi:hypothetical protein